MSPPEFVVAIPARLASTRLPEKPLQPLGGRPLITHVVERALAAGARAVWVATDDARIAQAVSASGAQVAMTASHHASGSDRLAECADIAGWADDALIVNLQGDEPFAPVAGIRAVAHALHDAGSDMSTLAAPLSDAEMLFDPNVVKLVRAANGDALYFSRAPLPWPRDAFASDRSRLPPGNHWLRHIGIYGYRAGFLRRFTHLPAGRLEQVEALEQLRALEHGARIAVALTPEPFPPGVDTPDDLARAQAHLDARGAAA